MKLCKDCRWAVNTGPEVTTTLVFWVCDHPSSIMPSRPNLVTGQPPPAIAMTCAWARQTEKSYDGVHDTCGHDGRFWEPKDDQGPDFSGIVGFGEALTAKDIP